MVRGSLQTAFPINWPGWLREESRPQTVFQRVAIDPGGHYSLFSADQPESRSPKARSNVHPSELGERTGFQAQRMREFDTLLERH